MSRYGSTGPTSKQAYGAATQNTENRPTLLLQQVAPNSQTSGSPPKMHKLFCISFICMQNSFKWEQMLRIPNGVTALMLLIG